MWTRRYDKQSMKMRHRPRRGTDVASFESAAGKFLSAAALTSLGTAMQPDTTLYDAVKL